MIVGRYLGTALVVLGLALGVALLSGAHEGRFALGLVRTWTWLGASLLVGLSLVSFCSGIAGSGRGVRKAGWAILALGAGAGVTLALNSAGVFTMKDTMQPWVLLAACVIVGGTVVFGSSS